MISSCARGIDLFRLLERGHDRRVQIGHAGPFLFGQLLDKLSIADEHLIISTFKTRFAGDVVKRRRLNERDPDAWEVALERFNQVFKASSVNVEDLLVERTVAGVIHAQHHGNDRGFVWENIALEPVVDATAAAPGHAIAAPARMDKGNAHSREPRHDVRLDKRRIKPLIGDTVPVEDDSIALLDRERRVGPQRR